MRRLCFLFVLRGCGLSTCTLANEDKAKTAKKKILLVSETQENREQSLISGRLYLQKLYEIADEFAIKRIAQNKLAEALENKYNTIARPRCARPQPKGG